MPCISQSQPYCHCYYPEKYFSENINLKKRIRTNRHLDAGKLLVWFIYSDLNGQNAFFLVFQQANMWCPLNNTGATGAQEDLKQWFSGLGHGNALQVQIPSDLPQTYCFNKPCRWFWCSLELEEHWFKRTSFLKWKRSCIGTNRETALLKEPVHGESARFTNLKWWWAFFRERRCDGVLPSILHCNSWLPFRGCHDKLLSTTSSWKILGLA